MKKLLLFLLVHTLFLNSLTAQITKDSGSLYPGTGNLSKEKIQDLFLLGKIWGFLKYFHPAVAAGKFDWDMELVNFLPSYAVVQSKKERSDSILSWINRLGNIPVNKAGDYDSIKDARLKPDFSWIRSGSFSDDLVKKLKYILENRARGDQYYIKFHRVEGLNIPEFQHENSYAREMMPSAELRLVALFRFWNIIEYWYPYKYNIAATWNNILKEQIPLIINASTAKDYTRAIQKLNASVRDGHGYVRSRTTQELQGYYYMPLIFRFVQNKWIVASVTIDSAANGIKKGDIVTAIDGIPVATVEKDRLPYIPAATLAAARLDLARSLNRTEKAVTSIRVKQNGVSKEMIIHNLYNKKFVDSYIPDFTAQKDSSMCIFAGGILYLNLGKLNGKDSSSIRAAILHADALILDLRQNMRENGEAVNPFGIISAALKKGPWANTFTTQQPDFAGTFKFIENEPLPGDTTVYYYKKNIVILINEAVISVGESMAMDFSQAYKAVLMGTSTSGTNGMNSYLMLPGNVATGFSGTGNYWRNRKDIQGTGIRPAIKVTPTIAGYKAGKDEILEKAIQYLSGENK